MKGYLNTKSIPKTEELLRKNGMELDRYEEQIIITDGYFKQKITRKTVFGQLFTNDTLKNVSISYESFDKKRFQKFLNDGKIKLKEEEWLDFLEKVAVTIGKELGFDKIKIYSNVKTKKQVEAKGYIAEGKYIHTKEIIKI